MDIAKKSALIKPASFGYRPIPAILPYRMLRSRNLVEDIFAENSCFATQLTVLNYTFKTLNAQKSPSTFS
jgi:hypothetical protein